MNKLKREKDLIFVLKVLVICVKRVLERLT